MDWDLSGIIAAVLIVVTLAFYKAVGLYSAAHKIDRTLIEGRFAGYNGDDLTGLFTNIYGRSGVDVYRHRLLPLDAVFAVLALVSAIAIAIWATRTSISPMLGMLAGGPLAIGAIFDLREGMALRGLMGAWLAQRPLEPVRVAHAAVRTRLKLVFYTIGLATALLVSLALQPMLGWRGAIAIVSILIVFRGARWWFSSDTKPS
jgi:hypothetical protein